MDTFEFKITLTEEEMLNKTDEEIAEIVLNKIRRCENYVFHGEKILDQDSFVTDMQRLHNMLSGGNNA